MKEQYRGPRQQKGVDEVGDGRLSPFQRLTIEPPPKETGPEQLYRVVYVIDLNATNPRQAAERAYEIMKNPASWPPVLDSIDSDGRRTRVDLSDP